MSDGSRDEKENHPRLAKSGHHFPEVAEDEEDEEFYFFFYFPEVAGDEEDFYFFYREIGQRIHIPQSPV